MDKESDEINEGTEQYIIFIFEYAATTHNCFTSSS